MCWSKSHRLKLNAAKTEVIWLGTRQQLAKLSQADLTLSIGDSVLQWSTVVRNLGVYIDEHSSMEANARQCAKTCFFHLRRTRHSCAVMIIMTHCIYADQYVH